MNTYNKIMKVIWLIMASVGFVAVTVMCFVDSLDKWVYYYAFVVLAFGMYFFKVWMMKRMERHLEFMSKKEEQKN